MNFMRFIQLRVLKWGAYSGFWESGGGAEGSHCWMRRFIFLLIAGLDVVGASEPPPLNALPLGDGKVSNSPRVGYVLGCRTFGGSAGAPIGGAFNNGPWIDLAGGTFNLEEKVIVRGAKRWQSKLGVKVAGGQRILSINRLPKHPTGTFPISKNDPAYQYDRNPNRIKGKSQVLTLPAEPTLLGAPACLPNGPIGLMLTGAAFFSGLDAQNRDAVAHEAQDSCSGHPEVTGIYHYHSASPCLSDQPPVGAHSEIVGYALDGFGLYGRFGESGKELGSTDLDECHGHTHLVQWDGHSSAMYHYHVTRDYPYTLGCFKGVSSAIR